MLKFFRKASLKWSLLVVTVVVALAFVTLTNAKASTSNKAGTAATVTNFFPQNNPQVLQIEPNKLVINDGWSLSVTKVLSLGATKIEDYGWHSPYKESDAKRSYAVVFTLENANGENKASLPKGKVLGAVGISGKYYELKANEPLALDPYNGVRWSSIGKGIFSTNTGIDVDLNEDGITKVIYQDENGNRTNIPVNIIPTIGKEPQSNASNLAQKGDAVDSALSQAAASIKSISVQTDVSSGRRIDSVNVPFVDDTSVIGVWTSVDFVPTIDSFNPQQVPSFKGSLYVKGLTFQQNGKTTQPWWTWTKGLLLHSGDKTACRYAIETIRGTTYMFLEWKSGDYIIRNMPPMFYVMKKESN